MTFKTLVYADPITRLRTNYVTDALKRDLPLKIQGQRTELITVNRHDFAQVTRQIKPNVIFIPENIGPISHHMRDFSKDIIRSQMDYVRNGGIAVYFGGASHYAMEEIEWFWDNGEVRYKGPEETFSHVAGILRGPHHRNRLSVFDSIQHHGCFEVPITVPQETLSDREEKCWQGNCGSFEIETEDFEALAYYKEVDTKNIAAAAIPVGDLGGAFILCSILPHYKSRRESPLWDKILNKVEGKKTCNPVSLSLGN